MTAEQIEQIKGYEQGSVTLIQADEGASYIYDGEAYPIHSYDPLDFMERFTLAEKTAIVDSSDVEVKIIYGTFLAAKKINPFDPRTMYAFALLAEKGILTEARKSEILS